MSCDILPMLMLIIHQGKQLCRSKISDREWSHRQPDLTTHWVTIHQMPSNGFCVLRNSTHYSPSSKTYKECSESSHVLETTLKLRRCILLWPSLWLTCQRLWSLHPTSRQTEPQFPTFIFLLKILPSTVTTRCSLNGEPRQDFDHPRTTSEIRRPSGRMSKECSMSLVYTPTCVARTYLSLLPSALP